MIKAVSTSLLLILLCGSVPQAQAQPAADAGLEAGAAAEAVRRQAAAIQIRKTIQEGRAARAEGDIATSVRKYEEAWRLSSNIGTVEEERRQIQAELVPLRLELARKAQSRGDLMEASTQVRDALRINPLDPEAREFKANNDRRMAEREGRVPSPATLELSNEIKAERIATSTLVQDARFLIEAGRLDEAEKKLMQAVKQDPEHRAAFYYLALIKEARFSQEARKREVTAKEKLVEVEKSWNPPITRQTLPSPNPMARTNIVYTSSGRQGLYRKLETIVIDRFPAPTEVDLAEALKLLDEMVRNSTIDKRGINFLIAPAADRPNAAFAGVGAVDPLTGLPTGGGGGEPLDVEKFKIKFDPEIRNVTLLQFLDALVMVAKPPEGASANAAIKYSVEDYAIVFSQRAQEFESLYSRTFKLNPNTIRQGLEGISYSPNPFQGFVQSAGGAGGGGGGGGAGGAGGQGQGGGPGGFFGFGGGAQGAGGGGGGGGGGQTGVGITFVTQVTNTSSIQVAVREFFAAAGVDIPTNSVAGAGGGGAFGGGGLPGAGGGKAMFFNDRTGLLLVRATLRDLDIIESAIQMLNTSPPQVTIEAKFAEISQSDNKELGFDWYLGNFLMNNGKVGTQGGTAPSANGAPSQANPAGAFPVPGPGTITRSPNGTDQLLTGGLRTQGAPALATMTGILTDPQFRVVLRAMEQRTGVDLLSAPKVTTVSGRQARINVEETATIITGLQVQGLGGAGGGAAAPAAQ